MRSPVIVVTGGIASGKTMVASVVAGCGGALVDCDALAHRALALDAVKRRLACEFGGGTLTRSGNVSKAKLRAVVFSDDEGISILNEVMRPHVTRIISAEVSELRRKSPYIVLDAVLFFHYTFRFKVDLAIVTAAPEQVRIGRLIKRDGITRREAEERIERQRYLEGGWQRADCTIRTDGKRRTVMRAAAKIRDGFLARYGIARRMQ